MKIFDLHCDTLSLLGKDHRLIENTGHVDIKRMMRADFLAQCFAVFTPETDADSAFFYLKKQYLLFESEMRKHKFFISSAQNCAEILENSNNGVLSAVLTVENGSFIGNDLARLTVAHDMGIKMITLLWNDENCLGYPHSNDKAAMLYGLKPTGKQAVEIMNSLNILTDVSHLNYGGFWDVIKLSKKPVIASHSACDALFRHTRNLTDEQLRAIGNSGGVIGVNFYARFIKEKPNLTLTEDIVAQIKHIKNTAGTDAVALGSDFDGMDSFLEFGDCGGMQKIADAILKEFTCEETEKFCYKNALRVFC